MRILITGGTGFIGRHLVTRLLHQQHEITVLTRKPESAQALFDNRVSTWTSLTSWHPSIQFDAVINLAGEPIIDKPWTNKRKQVIAASRIDLTSKLVNAMTQAQFKPSVFLSGSAIGIYGDAGTRLCSELTPPATDYGSQLCNEWENTALHAQALGVRTCLLRTGLVLHRSGGLLKKLYLPFSLGLGSQLGSGQQMMSWIHLDDYLDAVLFLLENTACHGAYNLTAPHPVSNSVFTTTFAQSLSKPVLFKTPAWLIKLLLGQRAVLLLGGQNVLPAHLLAEGFEFKLPYLRDALDATRLLTSAINPK